MKKMILTIAILAIGLVNGFSQSDRVTYSPDYRSRDCKNLELDKIEITKDFTIVTMTYNAPPNNTNYRWKDYEYISFKKGFIEVGKSKYKLLKSDINNVRKVDAEDDLEFNLYFKPLKKGIDNINICETKGNFNFFGVEIDNPSDVLPIPTVVKAEEKKVVKQEIINIIPDVDQDIPLGNTVNDKTFAVVIGNETYSKEIQVKYAVKDAAIFKQYLQKTLGLPDNNIEYIENGTFGQILDALNWINSVTKAFNGQAKIIFYYAGHGMPDELTKSAYLLPVDGNSQNLSTAIKLTDIYGKLTEFPSISVTVLLDACFSGSARETNGIMLAEGRGVKVKPKNEILSGNLVVLSATSGDETAFPYNEKQHGLFTYFLLKGLQDTKGKATLSELSEYIISNVSQQSIVVNKKSQTPQVNAAFDVKNTWQTIKLK